ncbi:hypothetical protein ACLB2K_061668 [Fragaria x ananassa]
MGFLTFAAAGFGLILMGTFEAIASTTTTTSSPPSNLPQSKPQTTPSRSSFIYFLSASLLSFLFILNSLISFFDAVNSNDRVGSAQQLQVAAIAALFLLYSLTGLLTLNNSSFPSSLLNLIGLFAFVEEFMYFYLRRKDTVGIENRYFDMLLVPIFVCLFATLLQLRNNSSSVIPNLVRGVGLVLQGLWFFQMGLSIYTRWMADGCVLKEKSRGNYTVKCKGHPEYHRARAIATLQFNCHLALIVILVVGVYSVVVRKTGGGGGGGDFSRYKPLGAEMQHQIDSQGQFTLDSDEEEEEEEVREEGKVVRNKAGGEVELGANGNGIHT